jgi:hypothetical protein
MRVKIAWGYVIGRGYWWWDLETGSFRLCVRSS